MAWQKHRSGFNGKTTESPEDLCGIAAWSTGIFLALSGSVHSGRMVQAEEFQIFEKARLGSCFRVSGWMQRFAGLVEIDVDVIEVRRMKV